MADVVQMRLPVVDVTDVVMVPMNNIAPSVNVPVQSDLMQLPWMSSSSLSSPEIRGREETEK